MAPWRKWLVCLFVLISGFVTQAAVATTSSESTPLVFLAKHERWLALLHWNQGTTFRSRNKSYVTQESFLLSPHGRSDALSELNATVRALKPENSPERCRFPARYRFLSEHLGWSLAGAFDHCDEYQEWRAMVPDARVVLVFPDVLLICHSRMILFKLSLFNDIIAVDNWSQLLQAVNIREEF